MLLCVESLSVVWYLPCLISLGYAYEATLGITATHSTYSIINQAVFTGCSFHFVLSPCLWCGICLVWSVLAMHMKATLGTQATNSTYSKTDQAESSLGAHATLCWVLVCGVASALSDQSWLCIWSNLRHHSYPFNLSHYQSGSLRWVLIPLCIESLFVVWHLPCLISLGYAYEATLGTTATHSDYSKDWPDSLHWVLMLLCVGSLFVVWHLPCLISLGYAYEATLGITATHSTYRIINQAVFAGCSFHFVLSPCL